MKVGVLDLGKLGKILSGGFLKHSYEVMIGTGRPPNSGTGGINTLTPESEQP